MTKLVLNSIPNCIREPRLAEHFDELFAIYQKRVNETCSGDPTPGSLGCIYVQFQFDADWEGAPRGMKIGRYSKKHNDVSA